MAFIASVISRMVWWNLMNNASAINRGIIKHFECTLNKSTTLEIDPEQIVAVILLLLFLPPLAPNTTYPPQSLLLCSIKEGKRKCTVAFLQM